MISVSGSRAGGIDQDSTYHYRLSLCLKICVLYHLVGTALWYKDESSLEKYERHFPTISLRRSFGPNALAVELVCGVTTVCG